MGAPAPVASDDILSKLAGVGAVLFGRSACADTAAMRAMLRSNGPADPVAYIACDGEPEEQAICQRARVQDTPLVLIGGVGYEGVLSLDELVAAVELPATVAKGLEAAKATLYGRDSCIWTQRQQYIFGPHAQRIHYVECSREAESCERAGIQAVPTWVIPADAAASRSHSVRLEGFHHLPQLKHILQTGSAPGAAAAASSSAGPSCDRE